LALILVFSVHGSEAGRVRLTKERISIWLHEMSRSSVVDGNRGSGSSAIRAASIILGAMFDAVNTIEQKYEPYLVSVSSVQVAQGLSAKAIRRANPVAAAGEAARVVLDWLYAPPGDITLGLAYFHRDLNEIFQRGLNDQDDDVAAGVQIGNYVGNRFIANRTGDGHSLLALNTTAIVPVENSTVQGQYGYGMPYYPANPLARPQFAAYPIYVTRPFGTPEYWDAPIFAMPPPPTLNSPAYIADLADVYGIGASNPLNNTRTPLTDLIGRFHNGFFGSNNGFASDVISQEAFLADGVDLLRVLTIASMASHDAHAAHWYHKFIYLRWRPIHAFRTLNSGLPAIDKYRDNAWTTVIPTPPHPDYPSGHSTRTSGFVNVFKFAYGDNFSFKTLSFSVSNATREFNKFSAFIQEVSDARVYAGIHFRSATVAGENLGLQVATDYWSRLLRPLNN